jgi:ribonuclease J
LDLLLLEGTTLSRSDSVSTPETERALEQTDPWINERPLPALYSQPFRRLFDVVSRHRSARIYLEEIGANPRKWIMVFRGSMTRDIDRLPAHTATTLIYSLWPGYLDRDSSRLASWCQRHGIALKIAHTSGHADPNSLVRLAQVLDPRMIIPMHTEAPRIMESLVRNVHILHDGDWLTV